MAVIRVLTIEPGLGGGHVDDSYTPTKNGVVGPTNQVRAPVGALRLDERGVLHGLIRFTQLRGKDTSYDEQFEISYSPQSRRSRSRAAIGKWTRRTPRWPPSSSNSPRAAPRTRPSRRPARWPGWIEPGNARRHGHPPPARTPRRLPRLRGGRHPAHRPCLPRMRRR